MSQRFLRVLWEFCWTFFSCLDARNRSMGMALFGSESSMPGSMALRSSTTRTHRHSVEFDRCTIALASRPCQCLFVRRNRNRRPATVAQEVYLSSPPTISIEPEMPRSRQITIGEDASSAPRIRVAGSNDRRASVIGACSVVTRMFRRTSSRPGYPCRINKIAIPFGMNFSALSRHGAFVVLLLFYGAILALQFNQVWPAATATELCARLRRLERRPARRFAASRSSHDRVLSLWERPDGF